MLEPPQLLEDKRPCKQYERLGQEGLGNRLPLSWSDCNYRLSSNVWPSLGT
uniref:Uncharacterized protein n=1 Tax=Rhizophora mucronata TaxID=61149 RepID=A0A2P2QFJ0_RHIMU